MTCYKAVQSTFPLFSDVKQFLARYLKLLKLIFNCLCLVSLTACSSTVSLTGTIDDQVEDIRAKYDLVGIGLSVADSNGRIKTVVSGNRIHKKIAPIKVDDAWHIGSNTKALTALLFARLVDQGITNWEKPLPEYFPERKHLFSPEWDKITMTELFAHRSGIGQIDSNFSIPEHLNDIELRALSIDLFLTKPPKHKIGKYSYNNLNYIIAGAIIETILSEQLGRPINWEEAMYMFVFDKATREGSNTGWGYGPPPKIQGHSRNWFGKLEPVGTGFGADNLSVMGPAGTVHAPIESHALLLTEFLSPAPNFLSLKQRDILLEAYPSNDEKYALGWAVEDHPLYGKIYSHTGSNTFWHSLAIIAPSVDKVVVVNTNQADGLEALEVLAYSALSIDDITK